MALQDSGRAIGAVSRLLQDHLVRRGFNVSIGKPEQAAATDTTAKLNLYLYEAGFDPHLRNASLQGSDPPPLWLVLKYLLTAFDAAEASDSAGAHELLGAGMAALHELALLPLDAPVPLDVRLALENNPEPLKLSFDETNADLLSKTMQGAEERYRLSVGFQVRPVLIVPAILPRAALLVGIDYTTAPSSVIGRGGVQVAVIPSLGARLDRVEPVSFEPGASLVVFGEDVEGSDMDVVLGNVQLTVAERRMGRLIVTAEGSPGAPIAGGTVLSAGEMPLVVRRRLSANRFRSSNLLAARLLPSLQSAAMVAGNLVLTGLLLGLESDDVGVLLVRAADGATVRQFDTFSHSASQQTLTVIGAATGTPPGNHRVVLRVNGQQARSSPGVTV